MFMFNQEKKKKNNEEIHLNIRIGINNNRDIYEFKLTTSPTSSFSQNFVFISGSLFFIFYVTNFIFYIKNATRNTFKI